MRTMLVAGASGRLGREITAELHRRGYATRALVRERARLSSAEGVDDVFVGDATRPATLGGVCEGVEVVVTAMGASLQLGRTKTSANYRGVDYEANRNLLAEAQRRGRVRKFVYVSLFGAEALRGTAYVDAHEEFVRELKASGLDYTVVRPTGFFYIFAEVFKMAERGRVMLIGDGAARTNPVHEKDVACACADAVDEPQREIPIGGPEVYTRREIAELAFEALHRPPKISALPAWLMRAMARPVRLFDRRLYEFLDFGVAVNTVDVVAPQTGARSLKDYFRRLAEARRTAGADDRQRGVVRLEHR